MAVPLELPDLGSEHEPVLVSGWNVEVGDVVLRGDRVVEVVTNGVTFDVASTTSGVIERLAVRVDDVVEPGSVLAWIAVDDGAGPKEDEG